MKKIKQSWIRGYFSRFQFRFIALFLILPIIKCILISTLNAQPEVMAWGNLTGIRTDGQLMEFESSLRVVGKDWFSINSTGKEKQQPKYHRDGNKQTITTSIRGFRFTELVEDSGKGSAVVSIKTSAEKDTLLEGVFFCIDLPGKYYSNGSVRQKLGSKTGRLITNLATVSASNNTKPVKIVTQGIIVKSELRQLEIGFNSKNMVLIRKDQDNDNIQIYIGLMAQTIKKGQEVQKVFTIKADGPIDNSAVEIVMDPGNPEQKFDGLGGNFRLQNPKTDPPVIQYCLDNLRVAWGRVEMPWNFWQPDEKTDPIEAARSGNLNPRVRAAMEMAQKLTKTGMPVIVSDWAAPNWAIQGDPRDAFRNRSKGIYGYQLNPEKMEEIYRSIGGYLLFMKQNYGVEADMFSFNESDLGINVRHTGREHADFIKGLGAHLASIGLSTKMLLGDNSDATTFDFIIPAMNDPETNKYIGAISFHSWRGCTDSTLRKWASASKQLNLPLVVAEGSTDAAAWNYPEIFSEQSFALYEINLYIRLCAICQPVSILQWQLTADYSLLTGEGIFGTKGPLHPTQRFWNLKQLASTPAGSFALPVTCNKESVNCAAFGNISRGEYALHIVNNGAECQAVIKGIPGTVAKLSVFVTNNVKGMEKTGEVEVVNGIASFKLHSASFITLLSNK